MTRHVVLWELHDPARAGWFAEQLRSCAALAPGTLGFDVGTRGEGFAASADVGLVADFADAAALRDYENHPRHRAVSAALAPLRRARHVLDFELNRKRP